MFKFMFFVYNYPEAETMHTLPDGQMLFVNNKKVL